MHQFAKRQCLIGFALCFLFVFAGCESVYLDDPADSLQNRCLNISDPYNIDRPGHVGNVLTIRLTSDGRFVNRCELTDVLYELNWDTPQQPGEYRPRRKPDAIPLPKLVVLYIHGWKHDASSTDKDLVHFTDLINYLQRMNAKRKQVLGVYIGWNATSRFPPFGWPIFDNLTFWSKQTIADRIAQTGVVTRILASISSIVSRQSSKAVDPATNQFIAIGHSFGARILFSATNQTLIYQIAKAHPGYPGGKYQVIEGIANAVILLNPAFEAARYTPLAATTRWQEVFADTQLPLLLSISSEGDLATKQAFPLGQWLGGYRSDAELFTLGNFPEYQTHTLLASNSGICRAASSLPLSEYFVADDLCLVRDDPPHNRDQVYQPRNPFLIAHTSADIIADHNDIWGDRFSQWLFAYINELGKYPRNRAQ